MIRQVTFGFLISMMSSCTLCTRSFARLVHCDCVIFVHWFSGYYWAIYKL